jgi:hypothetical protein
MWSSLISIAFLFVLASCGGGSDTPSVTNLFCDNNGNGTQTCIDGNGNVTDSQCVTINGTLATSTGEPCDASTTTNPPAEPTPEA